MLAASSWAPAARAPLSASCAVTRPRLKLAIFLTAFGQAEPEMIAATRILGTFGYYIRPHDKFALVELIAGYRERAQPRGDDRHSGHAR